MKPARWHALGALVLALGALGSEGHFHADEYFQVLEFAAWKLGLRPAEGLPWEFGARLRPAFQPALVVALHKAWSWVAVPDPFVLATVLRLLSAALTWTAMVLMLRGAFVAHPSLRTPPLEQSLFFLSFLLWPVVFNGVRFSSEGWAASLFAIGFARYAYATAPSRRGDLATGLLLGAAFLARYQAGVLIAGLLAWSLFVAGHRWQRWGWCAAGVMLAVGGGILLDRWFYGEWAITAVRYFTENLVEGRAATFGVEPWWYYFTQVLERAVPPFSLLYLFPPLLVFMLRWRDPLTWAVVPFLLVHLLIGHKEVRFLFPLLCLLPVLVVLGMDVARARWWPTLVAGPWMRHIATVFVAVHLLVLAVVLVKPTDGDVAVYRTLYRTYPAPIPVYYQGEKPYDSLLDMRFYRRPDMHPVPWTGAPAAQDASFLVFTRGDLPEGVPKDRARLVASSIPPWALQLNVGGWVERTSFMTVWEVDLR